MTRRLLATALALNLGCGPADGGGGEPAPDLTRASLLLDLRPGEHLAFEIDPAAKTVRAVEPAPALTQSAWEAVQKAPAWLQADLVGGLRRLQSARQDEIAAEILFAQDARYLDEIAFVAAHTAPEDLDGEEFDPRVLGVNAAGLYRADALFEYAEILDSADGSTVRYRMLRDGEAATWDLPREAYYWHVVHIKFEDQQPPTFLDPRTAQHVPPEEGGVFWRDYLLDSVFDDRDYTLPWLLHKPEAVPAEDLAAMSAKGRIVPPAGQEPATWVRGPAGERLLTETKAGAGAVVLTTIPVESEARAGRAALWRNLLAYGAGNSLLKSNARVCVFQGATESEWVKTEVLAAGHPVALLDPADTALTMLDACAKAVVPGGLGADATAALAARRERLQQWVSGGYRVLQLHLAGAPAATWPAGLTVEAADLGSAQRGGYPLLTEALAGVAVAWNGEIQNLQFGRALAPGDTAADRVGNYVTRVLPDGVTGMCEKGRAECRAGPGGGPERAVEPVRIAWLHYGNCGEHQDLLGTASRAALLPNRAVSNSNEDHVWNELFLLDAWQPYQTDLGGGGTHLANPGNGQDKDFGGGKDISLISAFRGDGLVENATAAYSKTCTMKMRLEDAAGAPVDGALVALISEAWNYSGPDPNLNDKLAIGTWMYTGRDGRLDAPLGDHQNHYWIAFSKAGEHPPAGPDGRSVGSTKIGLDTCTPGAVVEVSQKLPGTLARAQLETAPALPGTAPTLSADLDVALLGARLEGENLHLGTTARKEAPAGTVEVFATDAAGLAALRAGQAAPARDLVATGGGRLSLRVPADAKSFLVVLSRGSSSHAELVRADAHVEF